MLGKFKIPTWFFEQLPAYLFLFLSARRAGAFDGSLPLDKLAPIIAGAIGTLAGIKLQSIADREAEEFRAAHPSAASLRADHHVQCHRAKAAWSLVAQATGLSSGLLRGDPWAFLLAFRAITYPLQRKAYRRWIRPLAPAATRTEGAQILELVEKIEAEPHLPKTIVRPLARIGSIAGRLMKGENAPALVALPGGTPRRADARTAQTRASADPSEA